MIQLRIATFSLKSRCSAVGSALRSGRRGRVFESRHLDFLRQSYSGCRFVLETKQEGHFDINLTYKLNIFLAKRLFYKYLPLYLQKQIQEAMRQVEFVPFRLTEDAEIFSIRIDGKGHTEFQKFLIALKDVDNKYLQHDLKQILNSLNEIGQHGVKEYFFRPEGKMKDRVCAIPLLTIQID